MEPNFIPRGMISMHQSWQLNGTWNTIIKTILYWEQWDYRPLLMMCWLCRIQQEFMRQSQENQDAVKSNHTKNGRIFSWSIDQMWSIAHGKYNKEMTKQSVSIKSIKTKNKQEVVMSSYRKWIGICCRRHKRWSLNPTKPSFDMKNNKYHRDVTLCIMRRTDQAI